MYCLPCFASLVIAAKKKNPWKTDASSGQITNLKQSILETFDIYGLDTASCHCHWLYCLKNIANVNMTDSGCKVCFCLNKPSKHDMAATT